METISIHDCQSDPGVILSNAYLIVKNILSNLNNTYLKKLKSVCQLWSEVVEEIMSKRIIIIKRSFPHNFVVKAMKQPELLLPYLNHQEKEPIQFVSDLFQRRVLEEKLEYERELDLEALRSESTRLIRTRIAIFPSLPEISIHRFVFSLKDFSRNSEKRISDITELIGIPKTNLKCILWFFNEFPYYERHELVFPSVEVPSIALWYDANDDLDTEYFGIAFAGKRINSTVLRVQDVNRYYGYNGDYDDDDSDDEFEMSQILSRLKSNFIQQLEKIKSYKFDHFKCVAFMCTRDSYFPEVMTSMHSVFKNIFPDIPVLCFDGILSRELNMVESNEKRIKVRKTFTFGHEIIFVLVWFN